MALYGAKILAFTKHENALAINLEKESEESSVYIHSSEPGVSQVQGPQFEKRWVHCCNLHGRSMASHARLSYVELTNSTWINPLQLRLTELSHIVRAQLSRLQWLRSSDATLSLSANLSTLTPALSKKPISSRLLIKTSSRRLQTILSRFTRKSCAMSCSALAPWLRCTKYKVHANADWSLVIAKEALKVSSPPCPICTTTITSTPPVNMSVSAHCL